MKVGRSTLLRDVWSGRYLAACEAYPVATPVRVTAPDGSQHDTITIGLPILTGDGSVCVPLLQPAAWVDIEAVTPWPQRGVA